MALEVLLGDGAGHVSPHHDVFDGVMEANHRISNVLTLIASSIRLQASAAAHQDFLTGDEVRLLLTGIAARIDSVGQVHRLLSSGVSDSGIDLGDQLQKMCSELASVASLIGPVELSCTAQSGCLVHSSQVVPLTLMVCEVITNAIKYAHPAGAPGTIDVSGSADKSFTIIEIADNGVGLPEGFDPRNDGGLGFQLVRSLAKQLGATLVFDTDSLGLRFKIFLPKTTANSR
jgi:two-component sensor histidine kinase